MKLIRTVDAAGQVLCHDITQIIPGEYKDARFRKGHVIQPEDIPVLLSIGKENLYVWEKHPGILHEDEAAALLYKAAAGKNIHGTAPKSLHEYKPRCSHPGISMTCVEKLFIYFA
mgnify:CR=1 FL=1